MNEQVKTNPKASGNNVKEEPKAGVLGEHPVGVSLGAIGAGAAAGAAGGAIGGPIGAVAGAAVGAVVGGLAGKAAAEAVNPVVETKYWSEVHSSRPYADAVGFDEFAPAYRYGWESYSRRGSDATTFESAEPGLSREWHKAKGTSSLQWDKARLAARDAWNRVELAARGRDKTVTH